MLDTLKQATALTALNLPHPLRTLYKFTPGPDSSWRSTLNRCTRWPAGETGAGQGACVQRPACSLLWGLYFGPPLISHMSG